MTPLVAVGSCWSCGRTFAFDPDLVPSVTIDPATNAPPDLGPPEDFDAAVARSHRRPICRTCVVAANARRAELGRADPIVVLPGAYPDEGDVGKGGR